MDAAQHSKHKSHLLPLKVLQATKLLHAETYPVQKYSIDQYNSLNILNMYSDLLIKRIYLKIRNVEVLPVLHKIAFIFLYLNLTIAKKE